MRKILILLLCGGILLSCMAGCGSKPETVMSGSETEAGQKLSAVVTIFPMYDWLRELLGARADRWDITFLTDTGVDMHSYQPTAADVAGISASDLFIYVGGVSDTWTEDALRQPGNDDRVVLDLLELLDSAAVTEEITEGMDAEEEEGDEEYDEHVWLSLRNAQLFCKAITEALTRLDPEGQDEYASNLAAYSEKLGSLDDAYRSAVEEAALDTLLFGDRFPFRYLTDDYGLTYYAAFPGCSAETEASFKTVAFLAGQLKELGLPAVIILEGSDDRLAQTIIESAGVSAAVLTMDSMQSTVGGENDESYLSVMEQNLAALKTALNP